MTRPVATGVHILILIDNTAPMNRTTSDYFPVISYAKSAVRAVIEDNMARAKRGIYLTIAYTNPVGRPVCITCQKPTVPSEINYLQVSPTGSFDETVIEGLTEFNSQRKVMSRDSSEAYFLPRKPDVYVVALFSNFEGLSRHFHEFSIGKGPGEEWLFRADENIIFFNTAVTDNRDYLCTEFKSALKHLNIDIVPLQKAYDYFQPPPVVKIFAALPSFTFTLCFATQKTKCVIVFPGKEPAWPFPYEFSVQSGTGSRSTVVPRYFCCKADRPVEVSSLKCDDYIVTAQPAEAIELGDYFLALSPQSAPFGLLTVTSEAMKLKMLPWNFTMLLDVLARGRNIPSKEDIDKYLGTVPVQYIDKTVQFLAENRWNFSAEAAEKKLRAAGQKKPERDDMNKRQDFCAPILIDPTKVSTEVLEDLMAQLTLAKCQYRMKKGKASIRINYDTISDDRFLLLEEVKPKPQAFMRVFERVQSPVTEDVIRGFLAEKTPVSEKHRKPVSNQEEKEPEESIHVDDTDRDEIAMLEDLVVLLRDKDTREIERRIQQIEGNKELCSFVRMFLLKTMQRFRLERCLPDAFVSMLTGVNT